MGAGGGGGGEGGHSFRVSKAQATLLVSIFLLPVWGLDGELSAISLASCLHLGCHADNELKL